MTYLKLRKPGTARAAYFFLPVPTGEIYTEIILDLTDKQIDRQLRVHERNGYSPRRFLFWAMMDNGKIQRKQERLLEVCIPGKGDIEPCTIITNYDAFLINGNGKMIERLFRYELPNGADGNMGGGTLQHGTDNLVSEQPVGYELLPKS